MTTRSGSIIPTVLAIEEKYQLTGTVIEMMLAERVTCRRAYDIVTHNFLPRA
jgi:hypothetical protein